MIPTFRMDERVKLVAAHDPRPEALAEFERDFGGRGYNSSGDLFADPDVEAIYIASPHQHHCEHALAAARNGKHVLVEKPMAVAIDDARRMTEAFRVAGLHLVVGPCHSFDAPVLEARRMIENGDIGRVRMLHALNCTDFLYRPRRPEELDTEAGGGVVFSQGVHQVDIARLLCGEEATHVSAMTGAWDPDRPTEGAYTATIKFESGAFASLSYSGYGRFDSDVWQDWIGELGQTKSVRDYGRARAALAQVSSSEQETDLKMTRAYNAANKSSPAAQFHEHFGPIIVFGEHGDLRISPKGVHVYTDNEQHFVASELDVPRDGVVAGLYGAIRSHSPPPQSGEWGLASLEICHAILESAKSFEPVTLQHQIGLKS
ncbi:MAG: Gfo/Idh/MocA family oxidoreductase [Hyphomicrobiaceae bacterium]